MPTSAASSPLGAARPRATTAISKGRSLRSHHNHNKGAQGIVVSHNQSSASETSEQQKAVVVGAGPVGLASAAMLASRGWKVDVLERRADPTENSAGRTIRTYPMAISEKGRRCLESVSVDIAEYLDGRPSTMLSKASRLVDWYSLNCALLACVRGSYPESITFHWECGLGSADSIDLGSRRLRLHEGSGSIGMTSEAGKEDEGTDCSYDLLVGADGAGSLVRAALKDAGCLNSQVVLDSRDNGKVYKAFHGLDPSLVDRFAAMPGPDNSQGMKRETFGKNKELLLNFWVGNGAPPDRKMSVMAVASEDTFEEGAFEGILRASDIDLPSEWIDAIVEQNAAMSKPNQFGRIIRNSGYVGPSAVLVGDAAHAVTSSLGNGCNLGLGSVRALAEALDGREGQQKPGSLQGALEDYSASWKPEAHSFQRMEQLMAISMRSTLLGALCKLAHLCSAAGGLLLRAVAPRTYPSPLFVFWAGTPTLSYSSMRRSYAGAAALGSGVIVGALFLLCSLGASAVRTVSGAL